MQMPQARQALVLPLTDNAREFIGKHTTKQIVSAPRHPALKPHPFPT